MKRFRSNSRYYAILATVLFFAVSIFIIVAHWIDIGQIDLAHTISVHVGLALYSSLLFAVSNTIVILLAAKHISELHKTHQFRSSWIKLIIIIAAGLLIASYFPFTGESWNGTIHRIGSWMSFGLAILFTLISMWHLRSHRPTITVGSAFIIYGAFCLTLFLGFNQFFWDYVLPIESSYIFLFFLFVLSLPIKPTPNTRQSPISQGL